MLFPLELKLWMILVNWIGMSCIPGSEGYNTKLSFNDTDDSDSESDSDEADINLEAIAKKFGLEHADNASTELCYKEEKSCPLSKVLKAKYLDGPNVYVDFTSAQLTWRQTHGGDEALVRAVGVSGPYKPYVIDATGGFGTDAYILVSYGCKVRVFEKHPLVASLLEDGIRRGGERLGPQFRKNIQFQFGDSLAYLKSLNRSDMNQTAIIPDVIYLDPMFPKTKKSALVKKHIRFLQNVLTPDPSNDEDLMRVALNTARRRVVVKRQKSAPCLGGVSTKTFIKSNRYRFDIYVTNVKSKFGNW
ncbi:hypothetical protein WDU94_010484 [Cyamophila willieti]